MKSRRWGSCTHARGHFDRHRRHGGAGEKAALVREAEKEVVVVENQYQDGAITHGERYNKIIESGPRSPSAFPTK